MNEWIGRSIRIAQGAGYLDKLAEVYPIPHGLKQPIGEKTRRELERLFRLRDKVELIRLLLGLERFPYQEPFLGSLRVDPAAIKRNPQTVERIASILFTMGVEKLIDGVERPKQPNRQLGSLFRRWLRKLDYPRLPREQFQDSPRTALLAGSNGLLREFADNVLGCQLRKRPDLVAKTPRGYVVAEAKFITTGGGNQDKSFREVLDFIRDQTGRAIRVGILDGVVWLQEKGLYGTIRAEEKTALSALLLPKFLESMR
jgi:hypothetical protein